MKFPVRRQSLQNLYPFFPAWIAPWILLGPVYLSGGALYWGTPFLQFVPWREWAWQMLFSGKIPLWNPLVGMGAPLIANYQSAVFYPPNWFLAALQLIAGTPGQAWGQALLVAFHLAWAGTGMVLLTRRLGFEPLAQIVSSLAFSMSSYLVSRSGFESINATVAWLPWVIWSVDRFCDPQVLDLPYYSWKTVSAWMPLALCLGMQLLAGHAQTTWYTLLLAFAWMVFWSLRRAGWRGLRKAFFFAGSGVFLAILLASIQLLPTAEYLQQSQRANAVDYDYAVNYSFWPWRFLTLFAPDLFGNPAHGDYWFNVYFWEDAIYIGFLPISLAIAAIISAGFFKKGIKGENEVRSSSPAFILGLVVLIVAVFFVAMGRYTPIFPFLYRYVPTFALFQAPTRISILAVFSLAILSGMGINAWHRPEKRALYWSRLGGAGAFAVTLGAGLGWYAMRDVKTTFIRAIALAGLWALGTAILNLTAPKKDGRRNIPIWSLGVTLWVCLDLLAAGWGLNPTGPISLYQTQNEALNTVKPMIGQGRIYLPADAENEIKFSQFLQVDTFEFKEAVANFRKIILPDANMLDGIASVNNFDPLVPGRYSRWMDQLQTRASIELPWWFKWMNVSIVEEAAANASGGVQFHSINGSSRFQWFACAIDTKDGEEAWEAVNKQQNLEPPLRGLDMPLVVEAQTGDSKTQDCRQDPGASIQVLEDQPNMQRIRVNATKAGWLFQADTWYPGWQASIDHTAAPLLHAEYLFRAIPVPAGQHTVEIVYRPISFYCGFGLSSLTLFGIGLYFVKNGLAKGNRVG